MKKTLLTTTILFVSQLVVFAQGELMGTITDSDTKESVMYGNVALYKNGVFVTGTQTDFEGKYCLDLMDGVYDMEVSYVGYKTKRISMVLIEEGKTRTVNVEIISGVIYEGCGSLYYEKPLTEKDNTTQGVIFTRKDIHHMRR